MAVKKHDTKKAAADAAHDEEAGLVPKGDAATEADDTDAVDDAVGGEDAVGEAVESVEATPDCPPPPITPATPGVIAQDRVAYENLINVEAEAFANSARAAYIEAALAGGSVEIVTSDSE